MTIRKLIVALGAFGAATLAQAEGFYVTGALGQAEWRKAGEYDRQIGAAVDCTPTCDSQSVKTKKNATGSKLGAGYRINNRFAVELTHNKTRAFKTRINQDYTSALGTVYSIDEEQSLISYNYTGLLFVPLGQRLELFGRLGVANWRVKEKWHDGCSNAALACNSGGYDRDTHWSPTYGLGLAMNVTRNVAVTTEWERMGGKAQIFQRQFKQDYTIDHFSLGLRIGF